VFEKPAPSIERRGAPRNIAPKRGKRARPCDNSRARFPLPGKGKPCSLKKVKEKKIACRVAADERAATGGGLKGGGTLNEDR
jgi:hypothetical protein